MICNLGDPMSLRHPVVDFTTVRKTARERKYIHFIRARNRAQDIHETNRREKKNLFAGEKKRRKYKEGEKIEGEHGEHAFFLKERGKAQSSFHKRMGKILSTRKR